MNNTLLTNIKHLLISMVIMVCCMVPSILGAQVDCDVVTITCNDMVQVSLNSLCQQEMAFDMIVENPEDDGSYTVTLSDMDGNPILDEFGYEITDNIITSAQVGDTIQVKATLDDCGVSCWGYAIVLDKLPPTFTCPPDITIDCDATIPISKFSVVENCGFTISSEDFDDGIMCDVDLAGVQYSSVLDRVWTVTDYSGNTSTCTQKIFYRSVDVDDIIFPSDYIITQSTAGDDFECSDLDLTDVDPSISGEPTFYGCPSLKFQYSDLPFEMCGNTTKILRTWFVIDWCTGEYTEEGQNIEGIDDVGPIFQCGETCYTIATTDGCSVDFNIPVPVANVPGVDPNLPSYTDCSDVSFKIYIGEVDQSLVSIDQINDPCAETSNDLPITYTEILPNSAGEYIFEDAEIGLYWYRYEFEDACGNITLNIDGSPAYCTADVLVVDGTKPHAVCEGNTKVSLNTYQQVEVLATSIDDNSFDECGSIVSYEVKRIDNNICESTDNVYGASVTFCCTDAHGGDIPVMLRVTDENGNIDECVGTVCVADNDGPSITCPANDTDTIDCSDSYDDAVFGDVLFSTNCPGTYTPVVTYDDSGLSKCGTGIVIKTITYTDIDNKAVASCDLTITVVSDGGLISNNITCPSDLTDVTCTGDRSPEALGSMPTINAGSACVDVIMTHIDSEPFVDPYSSACFSITRKWTIIDWCMYDVDNPTANRFTCTQQIDFNSTDGPTFLTDCTMKIEVADTDLDCEHPIDLTVVATDDNGCTPASQITYSWELDAYSNGIVDYTGDSNDASGTYPVGCHIVTYTATDNCGNSSTCEQEFCITSDKEPTPICRAELIWAMGQGGSTEVWANDFNIKSESACGTDGSLDFSFTEDGNTPAMTFTCDDIPNGIGAEITLNMYVIDSQGNSEFCEVTLVLQDNLDVCQDDDNSNARVAGRVYDENYTGVQEFEVELADINDDEMFMDLTDDEGDYEFESIEYYDEYIVAPTRNDLPKEGVSTLDIVLIQRHILNIQELASPYKMIAADADKSNSITGADLVEIRKLILDITDEFSVNTSWQFVDANHTFVDAKSPWDYTTQVAIPALYVDYANVEFVAVKTGDVNNSVDYYLHGTQSEVRGVNTVDISTIDQTFTAGEQITVTLASNDNYEILGAQFTVDFDADVLAYLDNTEGQLELNDTKVNKAAISEGGLAISADFALGKTLNTGSEMTTIYFTAKQDGTLSDVLEITSDITDAEAYSMDYSVMDINLEFIGTTAEEQSGFAVYQNEPNPFNGITVIPFFVDHNSSVELEVFDAAGSVLYAMTKNVSKGNNSFNINVNDIDASGVLFYRVQSGDQSAIKKMIAIKN